MCSGLRTQDSGLRTQDSGQRGAPHGMGPKWWKSVHQGAHIVRASSEGLRTTYADRPWLGDEWWRSNPARRLQGSACSTDKLVDSVGPIGCHIVNVADSLSAGRLLGVFMSLLLIGGCDGIRTASETRGFCFATSAAAVSLDLGQVNTPARRIQRTISVRNSLPRTLTIGRVKTSCEGVSVSFYKPVVDPFGGCRATIAVDLSDDPDFSGRLAVNVDVFGGNEAPVLSLIVRFEAPSSSAVDVGAVGEDDAIRSAGD